MEWVFYVEACGGEVGGGGYGAGVVEVSLCRGLGLWRWEMGGQVLRGLGLDVGCMMYLNFSGRECSAFEFLVLAR